MSIESLAELSDTDLLARVARLALSERQATAALIAHLAEIEHRKLYLEQGYGSLFSYCIRVLHLSEHAAYNRIEAARTAMRFPAVLSRLARGDVHLTAVRLLSPLFTPENHHELLAAAKHKSRREIEDLIAHLRQQPDVPTVIRRLPSAKAGDAASRQKTSPGAPAALFAEDSANGSIATPTNAPPARPAMVVPLAPERYKVQFTASAATREKLRRAQALLRHQIPNGDVAEVIDLALDRLVRDLEKTKFAATDRPRRSASKAADDGSRRSGSETNTMRPGGPAAPGPSRHIPAEVKRAVWQRDQSRCTFVGSNGVRCTEEGQLEFDHIRPHADGGVASVDNLRLLCRRHNQYEARQFFGRWQAEGTHGSVPRWG